ncbi:MAG: DMT family transporter [Planctomycetota bacterium]|nr:DMT family transporter [Planctomycetota bacterium]
MSETASSQQPAASTLAAPDSPDDAALVRRTRLAVAALALCCVCWGFSFPGMKIAMAAFERHLPRNALSAAAGNSLAGEVAANATFIGWRFAVAAVLYWLVTRSHQRRYSKADVHGGILVGLTFASGIVVQIGGLRYTLPSVSGFLTALVVVFAPLAQAFLLRRRVGTLTWLAIGVAILGIVILSLPKPGAIQELPPAPSVIPVVGEALTVFGAVLFTVQILAVDHYGQQAHPARLTLIMFATTAILATLLGAILDGATIYNSRFVTAVLSDHTFQWSSAVIVVLSSVVALHLMNVYQPFIAPAKACVVYCLEPVFALLFSILFRTENLTFLTTLGGAVIIAAVLLIARVKTAA